MAGKIYVVENAESLSLIRAVSPTRALNQVVKSEYQVRPATPDDVEEYMKQGGVIEDTTIQVGNMEIPDPELEKAA